MIKFQFRPIEDEAMQAVANQSDSFEGHILDLTRGCLRDADREIELWPKRFEMLRYLVENAGRLDTQG